MKFSLLATAVLYLPTSLSAAQVSHPCIDDYVRFLSIADEVGAGEMTVPFVCDPELIQAGLPVLYSRYCDREHTSIVRASIVFHEGPSTGMNCSAGLSYGGRSPSDCSAVHPMDVNMYRYSDREKFLAAMAKMKELCQSLTNGEGVVLSESSK